MRDVVVIGGGPAGSAAALVLARKGLRVSLVDPRLTAFRPDENVASGVKAILRELGLLEPFLADGHSPNGDGFHVERSRFDAMLRDAAAAAGVVVFDTACVDVPVAHARSRSITLADGQSIDARFFIDASGRSSRLARRRGAYRIEDDALIAVTVVLEGENGDDATTLIEPWRDGWWYTAPMPDFKRMVMLHRDGPLEEGFDVDAFLRLMSETHRVRERCRGLVPIDPPIVQRANSGRLDRPYGDGWAAVGDAALSFDPLASQGVLTALYCGTRVGEAVAAHLGGNRNALHEYSLLLSSIYLAYLRQRQTFYAAEERWRDVPFWKSRQAHEVTESARRESA
jgi:flavin-dependent dehydrogenase